LFLAGTSQLLDINGTLIADLIAFLLLLGILARWVYPPIVKRAEERQRLIAEQLEAAEKARHEAEERLRRAEASLDDARKQAQETLQGANRSAEQLRVELREKAEEGAKRLIERAQESIEAERKRALDSVRKSVAELVVEATEKVIGEALDERGHKKLIDEAIKVVGNGRRRG
jgi:F-type H+-transporting ATPase subunit b